MGQTSSVFSFALNDHCRLRLLEATDAEELHEVVATNRELLARWMPWAAEQTLEGTREFVLSTRRQLAANEGFQAAIIDQDAIAGVIGFNRLDWENRSASLGYWLAEASQGRGIVTSATAALIDHAFGVWKLNRIEIRAGTENVRSQRVPERLGFVEEGVLREAERVGERYINHVLYSVLARDWNNPVEGPVTTQGKPNNFA